MHIVHGTSVSKGKASGNLLFIDSENYTIPRTNASDIELELKRFQRARADAMNQLQSVYERALHKVGESDAKIFVIQQMMIHENGFTNSVREMIKDENVSAQYAVSTVAESHVKMLESTGDEYMQARKADVWDLSQRVIRILTKRSGFKSPSGKNIIIYKHSFTPSEIIELDRSSIAATITYKGSLHSHSAILARAMKLPGITEISEDIYKFDGKKTTVDADSGKISIEVK